MSIYPERGKWVVRMDICGPEEFIADTREEALALARNRINEALTAALSATDYLCSGWAA